MSTRRCTVRLFCVILLLLNTTFFDKIAILTKLSATKLGGFWSLHTLVVLRVYNVMLGEG